MQFIDVNCMIGEWGLKELRFKTASRLIGEMDRLGIEKALVFHSRSWLYDPRSGNDAIIAETKESGRLIPVISLTSLVSEFGGRTEVLRFLKDNRVGAVRLFPNDHNYTLNLWNVDKLFSILDECRMPAMIECRPLEGSVEACFGQIVELAHIFQNTPIILMTTGYRSLRTIYCMMDKCRNIFMDTSTFITYRGIEDMTVNFGAGRLMYGSRMPFIEGGVGAGRIIYSEISEEEKHMITYGNIMGLLQRNICLQGGDAPLAGI